MPTPSAFPAPGRLGALAFAFLTATACGAQASATSSATTAGHAAQVTPGERRAVLGFSGSYLVKSVITATAGAYVWVDDRCHRAGPQEACAYLQGQLDDVLARIRSVSMDAEAPLKQQADDLRERMRGC